MSSSASIYPVAVLGGGPVGLCASILLSLHGIDHVLFERYPSTSIHPKACGLNQRTAEIFDAMGVLPEILKRRAPPDSMSRTAWYTSLGPNGQSIHTRDAWGGNAYAEEYAEVSPAPYLILPQIRLEPILKDRALQLNDKLFYNSLVTTVEEHPDHVTLTVQHASDASPKQYACKYLLGCDGGRSLTTALSIPWLGESNIVDMISAHIQSPISLHHPDPSAFISWFISPELGGSIGTGYLYHLGPYPSDPATEEWVFACALNPNDPKKFTQEDMLNRINATLRIPDLPVKVLTLSHWHVNALVAARYRSKPDTGRIFLAGDAGHRIPPWGALGANSGIQDIFNLVWKLAFALKHATDDQDYNALLSTYDTERRPIGQRVGQTSLHNLRSHSDVMDRALGILPSNSEAENVAAMKAFLDPNNPEGSKARAAVAAAQKILDNEFHALGAEVGWFYPNISVDRSQDDEAAKTRHGGQLMENGELDCICYHPSTIPGHHLPHIWLESRQGSSKRLPIRDLVRMNKFVLITMDFDRWRDVESDLVTVEGISDRDSTDKKGDYVDIDGKWPQLSGVSATGAVLVRPDGIVAWRAQTADGIDPERLDKVIKQVLKVDSKQPAGEAASDIGDSILARL